MKFKSLILLIALFLGTQGSFATQRINAGISMDFIKDVNKSIIYSAPAATVKIPSLNYSDLGYIVKYKPINMLSAGEIVLSRKPNEKKIILNQMYQVPSVYNISFANGGELNFSNAQDNVEDLVKKNPNRPEYLYAYAIKLSNEKKYAESLSLVDRALQINPGYALGHFLKGDILRIMGYYKDAAREYYATIQINPYCTDAYFNIAKMLEVSGNKDLALAYYKMAYDVNPNDLEIRNQIMKLDRNRV